MPRLASRLAAALVLAAAAGAALAYTETHLHEISAPVQAYAEARIAAISALPAPTKAEKAERAKLTALVKKLAKSAKTLQGDFSELKSAGKTVTQLGEAGLPAAAAMTSAFDRASLALSERTELVGDHLNLISASKQTLAVQKKLDDVAARRGVAAAEPRLDKRAKILQGAEKVLTAALKSAEKLVRKAGRTLPPARFRTGDTLGPPGGRVAIPRDSGTELAGSSLTFAPSALPGATTILIGSGDDIVSGGSTPAGPALATSPAGLDLNQIVTVVVPYELPAGRTFDEIAVFADTGSGSAAVVPGAEEDQPGFVRVTTGILGTFQAGLLPPPTNQPLGSYQLQSMIFLSTPGTTSATFDPGVSAFLTTQTIQFSRNGSGRAGAGSQLGVQRQWTSDAPHHDDLFGSSLASGFDFAWTQPAPGRFAFSYLIVGVNLAAEGVVSADTNVIAFTGHADGRDIVAIGVRSGAATTAQLEGRWAAVELGITANDKTTEPFDTVFTRIDRTFTVDAAGAVAYDSQGVVRHASTEYRTQLADPIHVRSEFGGSDGGTEQWTINPFDGSLTSVSELRSGFFDSARGVIVSKIADEATQTLRLAVAVRQPDPNSAVLPDGSGWSVARYELGQGPGLGDRGSTMDAIGYRGDLIVTGGVADDTLRPTLGSVHALTGTPGGPGVVTWQLATNAISLPLSASSYAVTLDSSGSFDSGDGRTRYRMSGDGKVLLGSTEGDGSRPARGIVIGLR